jgi:Uma2 family endonuclease
MPLPAEVEYPDCDGEPMSDNTLQFQWIVTIEGNLEALFANDPNVFVAGDLLWYPVQGDNTTRTAPDALVVFGRPKGRRGSYRQWEENDVPPQVVFEVDSPGTRAGEMERKFQFYQDHGVEEYYRHDPDRGRLSGWLRRAGHLQPIADMDGWTSPRLGIRFEMLAGELHLYYPDGRRFATFAELAEQASRDRREKEAAQAQAEQERQQKQAALARAEQERRDKEAALARAEQEERDKEAALAQAEQERSAREAAQARAERLAARLRELGIEPEPES